METSKPKQIIEGFDEDFGHIVERLTRSSPSVRLNDFFKYWTDNHLDCLFANRFDPRELLEAVTEMNKRLVDALIDSSKAVEHRLIALYFILCLYLKQPERYRRKIRLTCDDVTDIQALCAMVEQAKGHKDANFSWHKLRQTDSIDFVEERQIYGPSMLIGRGVPSDNQTIVPRPSDPLTNFRNNSVAFIEDKVEPAINELVSVCKHYERVKEELGLSNVSDATVDIESTGSVADHLQQAHDLVQEFKSDHH